MRVLGLAAALVLFLAAPAAAEPVDDAAAALADTSVWVHPDADRRVDVAAVAEAVGGAPIKIAVLPAGPPVSEVRVLPRELSSRLPGNTVAVIAGRYFYAGSDVLCADRAGLAASTSIEANEQALDSGENSDITKALTDFVLAVKVSPVCAGGGRDTGTVLSTPVWVAGALGLAVAAVLLWVASVRRRARRSASAHRERARGAVRELADHLASLPPDRAAEARGLLSEAEALLAAATTDEHHQNAQRLAAEGLAAADDPAEEES